MKKKLTIFLLCICLFSCSTFNFKSNLKVVYASSLVQSISFFMMGLYASGYTYYGNGSTNKLQNDIEIYANNQGSTLESWLSPFQQIIVNTVDDVIKFTSAQLVLIHDFITNQKSLNNVSDSALTVNNYQYIIIDGVPKAMLLNSNETVLTLSGGDTFKISIPNSLKNKVFLYFTGQFYTNNDIGLVTNIYIVPATNTNISDISSIVSKKLLNGNYVDIGINENWHFSNFKCRNISVSNCSTETSNEVVKRDLNTLFFRCNGRIVFTGFNMYSPDFVSIRTKFFNDLKQRFNFTSSTFSSFELIQPTYAHISETSINTSDDLVVSVPDIVNIAEQKAIADSRNTITMNDLASAIDETLIGVAVGDDTTTEDDDETRVVTPDIPIDLTQDQAVTDEVVEDLRADTDPIPPPDPPPIVDVIDISTKFPFSIFGDFVLILNMFDRDPEAPFFTLGFDALGSTYEIVIDLSDYDTVARVLRLMELIAFISSLIFLTIKYIRGD